MNISNIVFVLFTSISIIIAFPCGHSNLSSNRTFNFVKDIEEQGNQNKLRNTGEYHSLSFDIRYKYFDMYNKWVSESYKNKMKQAIEDSTEYLGKLLSTASHNGFQFNENLCFNYFDSEETQTSSDVVIFPLLQTQNQLGEGVLASALACLLSVTTGRPSVGLLFLGDSYNFNSENADEYLHMLLIHEITHILVFDNNLFQHFQTKYQVTKEIFIRNERKTIIITPKVVEKAKYHFKCNSLEGVEVESQGGEGSAGSHWESRTMLGDYMVSTDYDETVISDISLALFEDSGWYKVNYYSGGLFRFGKNEGCEFLSKRCIEQKKLFSH